MHLLWVIIFVLITPTDSLLLWFCGFNRTTLSCCRHLWHGTVWRNVCFTGTGVLHVECIESLYCLQLYKSCGMFCETAITERILWNTV